MNAAWEAVPNSSLLRGRCPLSHLSWFGIFLLSSSAQGLFQWSQDHELKPEHVAAGAFSAEWPLHTLQQNWSWCHLSALGLVFVDLTSFSATGLLVCKRANSSLSLCSVRQQTCGGKFPSCSSWCSSKLFINRSAAASVCIWRASLFSFSRLLSDLKVKVRLTPLIWKREEES